MKQYTIPAILSLTILIAGVFAFSPVEQASTVHLSSTVTLGTDAITSTIIKNGAIGIDEIATDAITSTVFADDAITAAIFAADAITSTIINNGAIGIDEIATDAITSTVFADDGITAAIFAADAITSTIINNGAIGTDEIATDAITSTVFADDGITAGKIATDAITSTNLAPGFSTKMALTNGEINGVQKIDIAGDDTTIIARVAGDKTIAIFTACNETAGTLTFLLTTGDGSTAVTDGAILTSDCMTFSAVGDDTGLEVTGTGLDVSALYWIVD